MIMKMEKTISGHIGVPRGEWDARQRADVVARRATGSSTSFTIESEASYANLDRTVAQQLGDNIMHHDPEARRQAEERRWATGATAAASSSHGNMPAASSTHGNAPATPAMASEECPRREMAEHATKIGLSDGTRTTLWTASRV